MSEVFFISDLHLGHKNITGFAGKWRGNTTTVEEHDAYLLEQWNKQVGNRDTVWVLGDVAWNPESMSLLKEFNGNKKLILGNHDQMMMSEYMKYFNRIYGVVKYKNHWLSHTPIHPNEMRGMNNIHGHVHMNTIKSDSYINVCVENCQDNSPVPFDDLPRWGKNNV